jgi:hypothetical protein
VLLQVGKLVEKHLLQLTLGHQIFRDLLRKSHALREDLATVDHNLTDLLFPGLSQSLTAVQNLRPVLGSVFEGLQVFGGFICGLLGFLVSQLFIGLLGILFLFLLYVD